MQKFFKKRAVLATIALITGVATAATLSVSEVNTKVKELLAPFQSESTQVQVEFGDLRLATFGTRAFQVSGQLKKLGKWNTLELSVPEVRYRNTGRGSPRGAAKFNLKLDLVRALGQPALDSLANEAEDIVVSFAKDMSAELGDAVSISAKVDELLRDESGHVISLRMHVEADIDVKKLPEGVSSRDIPLLWGRIDAKITRTEAELTAMLDLNREYRGFDSDETGIREWIEGLLGQNPTVYEDLTRFVAIVDSLAETLVNLNGQND